MYRVILILTKQTGKESSNLSQNLILSKFAA